MKKISILALLTLVFLIVACTNNIAPIIKTPSIVQSPTRMGTTTQTPISTTTLTRTFTVTPPPQITATKLPTREITLTKTPQPTIESVEAEKIVQQYLRDNRGCRLPCWWGISPGSTTREEVREFLEPIGKIEESSIDEKLWFGYQLLDQPEGAYVTSTSFFKQGKVSYIFVFSNGTSQSYKLSQLLSNYGKPDEVNLQVEREVFDGRPPFDLFVIYRNQGIIARYKANTKSDSINFDESKNLKGCFTYGPDLWLFDTKDQDLSDLKFFYGGYAGVTTDPMSPPILSIDQATNMDIDTFYQKYRSSTNNCIYTPSNLWPDIGQMEATATAMASSSKTVEPQPVP